MKPVLFIPVVIGLYSASRIIETPIINYNYGLRIYPVFRQVKWALP